MCRVFVSHILPLKYKQKRYKHMILSYYWHRFHTSDPLRTNSFIHPTHTLNWRLLIILQGFFFPFNHSDHWIYKYPCSTWKSSLATTVLQRTLVQYNPSALSNVSRSWRIKIQIVFYKQTVNYSSLQFISS